MCAESSLSGMMDAWYVGEEGLSASAHFVVVEWRRVSREERSLYRMSRAGGFA